MASMTAPVISDPRTKYAQPPYSEQQQNLPGKETAMSPLPDHGETTYKGSGKLKDLVAVITGGDSGIGRAVALAYAREGADVVFTYFSDMEANDAQETRRLVEEAGQKVLSYKIDQARCEDCERVIDETFKHFGRLDILVNNAAYQETYESITEIPNEDLDRFFKTNIEAFYYFSRAALKYLTPGGSIINTSSIQAYKPSPTLSPYAATKAAIANFTVSLAKEAIKKGVRVNAVAPGPVWTPLIPASMSGDSVQNFGSNSLFERAAQPAELAPIYVFLASDDASFISGEIYGATGGEKQL